MAIYLLDTTTLTLLQRNHLHVTAAVRAHAAYVFARIPSLLWEDWTA
ncbi:hypothetical protein VT84_05005 [Gemmata sp. SH-PL17]|nr:hypothetical protein VT84_05005 [Gemmata sp. SH-PL17]